MHWSQTESSKCSLESMFNEVGPPFMVDEDLQSSSTSPSALMRRLKRCGAPLPVPALLLLLLDMHLA